MKGKLGSAADAGRLGGVSSCGHADVQVVAEARSSAANARRATRPRVEHGPKHAAPNVSRPVARLVGVIYNKPGLAAEIEQIYAKRYYAFCRMAVAVTGSVDAAHDAVQEGFARALAHREEFRGDGSVEGWVWRIILRVALDSRRNGRRVDERLMPDLVGDAGACALDLPHPERDPGLVDAVRSLSDRQRLVVFLRYFADLSHADIAVIAGIERGTVSATLSQAQALLARRLGVGESTIEKKGLIQ